MPRVFSHCPGFNRVPQHIDPNFVRVTFTVKTLDTLKRQPANDRVEPELLARLRNSAKGRNYARPSGYPRMR